MSEINLVMVLPDIEAMNYGIGTYISNLALGIKGLPIKLHVIKTESGSVKQFTIDDKNAQVKYLYVPLPRIKPATFNSNLRETYIENVSILLYDYIADLKNCIFQINYSLASNYIFSLNKYFNHPVVSVIHFASWHFALRGNYDRFKQIWDKQFQNQATMSQSEKDLIQNCLNDKDQYQKSNKVISVSADMRRFICKYYGLNRSKTSLVPNGIDTLSSTVKPTIAQVKKQLHLSSKDKIVLFVGRVTEHKGANVLIDAFRDLLTKDSNLKMIIVGKVNYDLYSTLCHNLWGKIIFTGHVDHKTLLQFYSIANVGVAPSFYEQCPYAVLEMMHYSVPVVAANSIGLNEILAHEDTGILVDPHYDKNGTINLDYKDLSGAIEKLLHNRKLAKTLAKNAKRFISDSHDARIMAKQMFNLFKDEILTDN